MFHVPGRMKVDDKTVGMSSGTAPMSFRLHSKSACALQFSGLQPSHFHLRQRETQLSCLWVTYFWQEKLNKLLLIDGIQHFDGLEDSNDVPSTKSDIRRP